MCRDGNLVCRGKPVCRGGSLVCRGVPEYRAGKVYRDGKVYRGGENVNLISERQRREFNGRRTSIGRIQPY